MPAGIVPSSLSLDVTGTPALPPDVLYAQVLAALDRAIRPTLAPGSSLRFGAVNPWPLPPLPAGARTAVAVSATIAGGPATPIVTGTTTVTINSVEAPAPAPRLLFLSDDPEYITSDGVVFRGTLTADRPARLYYYHSDIGTPRDLDVVLTATSPARVHLISSASGPDLDVLTVGHAVTLDLLCYERQNVGIAVDLVPGKPFVVRHAMLLQGEVVAGAVDMQVLGAGTVTASVLAAPAGSRPEAYLNAPRVPFDGHSRHGVFALDDFGKLTGAYTVGGPDVAVQYGTRGASPKNVDPNDSGRDYGDYGITHQITFTLNNPSDFSSTVYLYEKPLGGPVRSSFFVDGQLRELGCVRVAKPYWIATFQVPAHSNGATTTVTMTDGGSFYPLEFGITQQQPSPYTPPPGSPDGCSPGASPFAGTTAAANARRQ